MSGMDRNPESYITSLCQKARDLGASQAVNVPVADVMVDERTLLKCLVPICPHYGWDLMCPPNVLPVSKFKEILNYYHNAILIKVDVPLNDPPGGGGKEREDAEYMRSLRDAQKRLHEIVSQIECLCIEEGHHFAAGLIGGPCPLCEQCVGIKSGLSCCYPLKARPAMEAMGIDVMATARKAGLHLSFGQNDSKSWVGLILVD